MKTKKIATIGSINAASLAFIYDDKGRQIGTCLDTPNNMAFAMLTIKTATKIKTTTGEKTRKDLESRFNGLDANYHKQFIKLI